MYCVDDVSSLTRQIHTFGHAVGQALYDRAP